MPKMTAARAEREGRNDIAVNVIPSRRVVAIFQRAPELAAFRGAGFCVALKTRGLLACLRQLPSVPRTTASTA